MTSAKHALVVRGGWEGHVPVAATDRYVTALKADGYAVTVSDTLDSYLDEDLLAATDLVVQCWTMGEITGPQAEGLCRAVLAGTGLAGWHGGIIDAFRAETRYQLMTGGQFVYHPREFTTYQVRPVPEKTGHPVMSGIEPFTVTTEQYYLHVDPAIEVLAVTEYGPDAEHPELAGTSVPVAWTRLWGAGRVFVTTIGHSLADLEVPQVDAMIRKGMAWATR
ncbi:ThuA domain-containing protein [Streptomyces sp. ME02-8801-2C]|uniref:ThuA domain-containing protein n=1 Tax=Streptomyces sp. ME02-8801-2C TaxID=3028680 RepID=UPI0029ABB807|nr:ThuA domain-containing protein [Streptomyces sp. ME02-8801-2C]MDX3458327.1 ThuA domain-containing protein [Streptomyces sp. ME02-8801-2C]